MQLGFLIDHRRCIGCHACTVACKAENDVPVGSFRTWVKYGEAGRFPAVRRHFAVLRCNHCTHAPCVAICPVNALEKRRDGIVDIDRDACIGCKACMQACPYDAIYLNEDLGAVEKCHYCAHRVERNLEPACVVVCPENAIISGDLHDPASRIARLVKEHSTEVRRPEQRTGPNVHYTGHDPTLLAPGAAGRPDTFLWSERPPLKTEPWPAELPVAPDARVVLDAGHRVEWGWAVGLYLVTKGIAAGAAMLAPFLGRLGVGGAAAAWLPEGVGLIFTVLTTFLLAGDLARPWRFYRVLTRPNWQSWLTRGAVVLVLFGGLEALILLLRWGGQDGLADQMRLPAALTGAAVAGYTAFLFAQCEGRDLWQSPLLLPHLLAQAVLCGAALYLPFAPANRGLQVIFLAAAAGHLTFSLAERYRRHETANGRQAAAFLGTLRLGSAHPFRDGLLLGAGVAAALVFVAPVLVLAVASTGLLLYEWAFVRAAQLPPLS